MRTKKGRRQSWPSWRYGPNGESEIFQSENEVPYGWTVKPGQVFVPRVTATVNRDFVIQLLKERGITPNPTWSAAYMKELLSR